MSETIIEIPEDLATLSDDELAELAGKLDVVPDADDDRAAVEAKVREAAAAQQAAAAPPAEKPETPEAPKSRGGRSKAAEATRTTVTYLGRPETVTRDEEGEPTSPDVYQGIDRWDDDRPVNLAVGESTQVSAEKATQLEQDFPGAFEISTG